MRGVLLLNKPPKMTSHDCVAKIRGIFKTKKVGHIGTLDPDVTGVLPICINAATKIIPFIEGQDKEYLATIKLGYSTTTEDAGGEVIERDETEKHLTQEELVSVLKGFVGEINQTVPLYAAVRVNGKRLYEYAFKNQEVTRPTRKVIIKELELLSKDEVFTGREITFQIRVHCSKGTYIRTLATDIGRALGIPSHLSCLIRTKTGNFKLEECFTFEDILAGKFQLISLYDALEQYPRILADSKLHAKIKHGQKLEAPISDFTYIIFHDINKQVLAVYEKDPNNQGLIKPARVFQEVEEVIE